MRNPWAMKMEQFTAFTAAERMRLDTVLASKQQAFHAQEDIIADGAHSDYCHVLLTGLACRYKILPDGERQIMAFLVPGDLCDAEIFILKKMDHAVGTLTASTTAMIHSSEMKTLLREASPISEALWWGTMTDLGVLRERIIDQGRRDATERLAHLLYEMLVRYRVSGATETNAIADPAQFFENNNWVPIVMGIVISLSVHLTKMAARPALNALTFGAAAPIASTLEDAGSVTLTILAILLPVFVIVALAGIILVFVAIFRRARRKRAQDTTGIPSVQVR